MRTKLDPAGPSTTTSSSNTPVIHDELVELGLIQPGATPREQREAIRVFQQARHLPETGVLDKATRAELQDSVRMRRAMLRNAAAADEPVSEAGFLPELERTQLPGSPAALPALEIDPELSLVDLSLGWSVWKA